MTISISWKKTIDRSLIVHDTRILFFSRPVGENTAVGKKKLLIGRYAVIVSRTIRGLLSLCFRTYTYKLTLKVTDFCQQISVALQ